ncbi:S1 family peptidase [Pseudoalteromonas sp. GB56]
MSSPPIARRIYEEYAAGVAYVVVQDSDGSENIGSCFHVGDGIFVTARHVVEGKTIVDVANTEPRFIYEDDESNPHLRKFTTTHFPDNASSIDGPYYHPNEDIDVALLKVKGIDAPVIPLGDHLDDWLGTEHVMTTAIVLGFPPVPFSYKPTLIASKAEVNAVIDKYTGGHPHFILSSVARAGFSGGPAIGEMGVALGMVTESLAVNDQPSELGYLAVVSVEPILVCLGHHELMPSSLRKVWEDEDGTTVFDKEI